MKYLLIIFVNLLFSINSLAQVHAFQSIINPYKLSGSYIPAFSSWFSAVENNNNALSINPAASVHADRVSIFMSGSIFHNNTDIPSERRDQFGSKQGEISIHPGSVGLIIPSRNADPKMLLHLLYNPQIVSQQEWKIKSNDLSGSYQSKSKGNPGVISVGLTIQAMKKWGVSLTWTKWLGEKEWTSSGTDWTGFLSSSRTVYNYNGSNFQLSNFIDLSIFRLGFSYYTPLTLMTVSESNLSQEFKGAFDIGVSKQLSRSLLIALNYFYQSGYELKRWNGDNNSYDKYDPGQELTIGMEYSRLKQKYFSPVFILIRLNRMPPAAEDSRLFSGTRIAPDDRPGFELVLGSSINFSKFTILFSGHYQEHYSNIWLTEFPPPES